LLFVVENVFVKIRTQIDTCTFILRVAGGGVVDAASAPHGAETCVNVLRKNTYGAE
jgi:hypothetical protein